MRNYKNSYYELVYNEIYDSLMNDTHYLEFDDSERRYVHEVLTKECTLNKNLCSQSEINPIRHLVIDGIMKVSESKWGNDWQSGSPVLYKKKNNVEDGHFPYDWADSSAYDGCFSVVFYDDYKIILTVYTGNKNGYGDKIQSIFTLVPVDDKVETKYKILKHFSYELKSKYVNMLIDNRINQIRNEEHYMMLKNNDDYKEHSRNY